MSGMSQPLLEAAMQFTLPHMPRTEDEAHSVVTAAMWIDGGKVGSSDPWSQMWWNGTYAIDILLRPMGRSLALWTALYDLTDLQVRTIERLVQRRIRSAGPMLLTKSEWAVVAEGKRDIDEIRRTILAPIGLAAPA